jgi:16S rRNA (uracil1498-N3)-methyltransferase
MKRFVLSSPPNPEGRIRLYGEDYHYLVRVRRLKTGMLFDAVLPGGTEVQVRILSTVDNILIGECLEKCPGQGPGKMEKPPSLPAPIVLFQGLPKGSKMDLIIRQAAEAGVSTVAPFESEYSAVRLENNPAQKIKRWERIIREARQQSGSATETKVLVPYCFNAVLEYWESKKNEYKRPLGLLFHQEQLETPAGSFPPSGRSEDIAPPLAKGSFHDYLVNDPDFIALAVGPEGGFSPAEVSQFLTAGWKPLIMGHTILRTETAALYGIAAVQIILLEKETWAASVKE